MKARCFEAMYERLRARQDALRGVARWTYVYRTAGFTTEAGT